MPRGVRIDRRSRGGWHGGAGPPGSRPGRRGPEPGRRCGAETRGTRNLIHSPGMGMVQPGAEGPQTVPSGPWRSGLESELFIRRRNRSAEAFERGKTKRTDFRVLRKKSS